MNNFKIGILISLITIILSVDIYAQQPDAIYLKMTKKYQLNEDGSVVFHYSHRLKYLSNYSYSRKYGETSIIYNPKFQKVKVNLCKTTMADGKVVPAPDNAYCGTRHEHSHVGMGTLLNGPASAGAGRSRRRSVKRVCFAKRAECRRNGTGSRWLRVDRGHTEPHDLP